MMGSLSGKNIMAYISKKQLQLHGRHLAQDYAHEVNTMAQQNNESERHTN